MQPKLEQVRAEIRDLQAKASRRVRDSLCKGLLLTYYRRWISTLEGNSNSEFPLPPLKVFLQLPSIKTIWENDAATITPDVWIANQPTFLIELQAAQDVTKRNLFNGVVRAHARAVALGPQFNFAPLPPFDATNPSSSDMDTVLAHETALFLCRDRKDCQVFCFMSFPELLDHLRDKCRHQREMYRKCGRFDDEDEDEAVDSVDGRACVGSSTSDHVEIDGWRIVLRQHLMVLDSDFGFGQRKYDCACTYIAFEETIGRSTLMDGLAMVNTALSPRPNAPTKLTSCRCYSRVTSRPTMQGQFRST
jgi:hypothetical protein